MEGRDEGTLVLLMLHVRRVVLLVLLPMLIVLLMLHVRRVVLLVLLPMLIVLL